MPRPDPRAPSSAPVPCASYDEALTSFHRGEVSPAELVSHYVVERVCGRFGRRWRQGRRAVPLSRAPSSALLELVATFRLCGVPEPAARAICAWGEGARALRLLFTVPSPSEILALQARGARCVSLLPDAAVPAPHQGGLAFALHDLCHVEKLFDPEQYHGQVGFFSLLTRALACSDFLALHQKLDTTWQADLERVMADMNGSPIFLWAALKAGLRPALHRLEHPGLPFDPKEESPLYRETLARLLDWFGFPPGVREDAILVNDRQSHREASQRLFRFFEGVGRAKLTADR